jgi:hypothetical protein
MVCETLGIEPEYLRLGVRQWRKMQPRGDLGQQVARRSPVIRVGSIVSENPARERTRRSRRKRGQPIMLNEPTSATVNSSAHAI